MPELRIWLFGRLRIAGAGHSVERLAPRKVEELLAYLLLNRRPCSRERLAALLWADAATAQARSYLRKALWQLQLALGPLHDELLLVDADWVAIRPDAPLWLDLDSFERGYELAHGQPGEQLDDATLQAVEEAVALFSGELLDGSYQEWCLFERERLQLRYLAMLDKLMAACELRGRFEQGIGHGAASLRHDSAREQTHRRLMRLHYLAGDRTEALRQYERCAAALRRELGVEPTEATEALQRRIRASQPLEGGPSTHAAPPELLARLQQMQSTLDELHHRLHAELATTIDALRPPRA